MTRIALRVAGPSPWAVGLVLAPLAAGCVGGAAHLRADHLSHPVSLSRSYFGPDGSVIGPDRQEKVGRFSFVVRRWSLLWTIVPISSRQIDLSGELENRIRSSGGEAVVNLTLKVYEDPLAWFTMFLPVLPSRIPVLVEGDVVKARRG